MLARKTSTDLEARYKRARREWDDRMGDSVVRAKNWRLAFFLSIVFICFPCVFGLIYLGAQPKIIPHIVEVGSDSAMYRGTVGKSWENYTPTDSLVMSYLKRFIVDTRTISSDSAVIKNNYLEVYNFLTPAAANILNVYLQEEGNDPFSRATEERASVEITAAVPISGDTWQLDWLEKLWGQQGNLKGTNKWRGTFTVKMIKPKNVSDLNKNPIGLYINEFHWSKIS